MYILCKKIITQRWRDRTNMPQEQPCNCSRCVALRIYWCHPSLGDEEPRQAGGKGCFCESDAGKCGEEIRNDRTVKCNKGCGICWTADLVPSSQSHLWSGKSIAASRSPVEARPARWRRTRCTLLIPSCHRASTPRRVRVISRRSM